MHRFAWILLTVLLLPQSSRADFIDHFATDGDIGLNKVPSFGSAPVIVLPVIVDDQPIESPYTTDAAFVAHIQSFFSTQGELVDYYRTVSLDRYQPQPIVAAPIHFPTCPDLGGYSDCSIPRGGGLAEGDFVGTVYLLRDTLRFMAEILECARQGPGPGRSCTTGGGINFADGDGSGPTIGTPDGYVDGVLIVTNATFPGIALPVKWLSENPLLSITTPPLPTFEVDGVTVGAIGIGGRDSGSASLVAIHEFGHLLGFADLYNESGVSTDLPYTSMGGWYYDSPPPLLDPFSRSVIGWSNVQEVSGGGVYTLEPAAVGGTMLKLGTGDEFFLVEYRTREANVDTDLAVAGGVLVERVRLSKMPPSRDGAFLQTLSNCVNCEPWDALTMIEQADGNFHLEFGRGRDDAEDLFLTGDAILPSPDTSQRGPGNLIFSTNLLSGDQTGVTIRVLDIQPDHAVVEVVAPVLADPCADMARFCRGQTCNQGYCGSGTVTPPTDSGVSIDAGSMDIGWLDASSAPDGAASLDAKSEDGGQDGSTTKRSNGRESDDCGCTTTSAQPSSLMLLLIVFALGRRARSMR